MLCSIIELITVPVCMSVIVNVVVFTVGYLFQLLSLGSTIDGFV